MRTEFHITNGHAIISSGHIDTEQITIIEYTQQYSVARVLAPWRHRWIQRFPHRL